MTESFNRRYIPTGKILRGGGGDVYICTDPNLERTVAVKFLRHDVEMRRLLDEIHALQAIRSNNVVEVLDLVHDGSLGIGVVTEFLPGPDLLEPSTHPTNLLGILRAVHQLSSGIADIHQAGVVHRDIKPNNVKFDGEQRIKLFDFNLARLGGVAHTAGFCGTPGFAAPEQYTQGRVKVGQPADVYALAATIAYICLGGRLPASLLKAPPTPSRWLNGFRELPLLREAPGDLTDLLTAALSADEESRPVAAQIRDLTRDCICKDRHRALVSIRGNPESYVLDRRTPRVQLSHGNASIVITYDGLAFRVSAIQGVAKVNRVMPIVGTLLPASCVIDLDRQFITFDVSHPEVVQ
jgi:eukaryotic-like serine/threonine-protein kinase